MPEVPGGGALHRQRIARPLERRGDRRHDVELPMALLSPTGDVIAEGRVVNLGRQGVRVEGLPLAEGRFDWLYAPLVPEAIVRISIRVSAPMKPLVFNGRIQWRKGVALGLQLTSSQHVAAGRLQHAVSRARIHPEGPFPRRAR